MTPQKGLQCIKFFTNSASPHCVLNHNFAVSDIVHNYDGQSQVYRAGVPISVGRYHGTTVETRYFFSRYHYGHTVEVTVLQWYRNTTNTAVLPYGTCQSFQRRYSCEKPVYSPGE